MCVCARVRLYCDDDDNIYEKKKKLIKMGKRCILYRYIASATNHQNGAEVWLVFKLNEYFVRCHYNTPVLMETKQKTKTRKRKRV